MISARCLWFLFIISSVGAAKTGGDDEWVHLPDKCEVCKFVSIEMKSAFDETGKTKAVIDRNPFIDNKGAPPIKYVKSDLRFIEVVENVCQRLLEYNLHKERTGSNRFAKVSLRVLPEGELGQAQEEGRPGSHRGGQEEEEKRRREVRRGKGKSEEGEEGGDSVATKKKKEKKVKKKKKSKAPVEKMDGGASSDEEIQPQMPLSGQKTEL
ncbi:Protein canopy-like protein 3 [Nibea albiflora]|uniref:Protein canopy-like protein 3 n=1 Tax=Nibea albiflora TaxID=240163 RepID=A0ACB7EVF8_NIBAL|nr:Protein canopy-like protein 3 [Nibea albiflora]